MTLIALNLIVSVTCYFWIINAKSKRELSLRFAASLLICLSILRLIVS